MRRTGHWDMVAVVALLTSAGQASVAEADAIRAPRECREPGWIARRVGHGGWGVPRTCETDADCAGGGSCEEVRRCWLQSTYSVGRRRFPPGEERPTRARAQDRCNEDGTCSNQRAECREPARECVYGPEFSREAVWDRGAETPAPERVEPEPEPAPEASAMTKAANPNASNESASSESSESETESSSAASQGSEGCCAAGTAGTSFVWLLLFALRRRRA